ncbi:Pkinase-domain-containing protein [Aspergillus campestris IBT 28561]|uniref:Pkinase-domain-containing protein n=1 Tax=Aspergillus campestris (strain IBT 28561) TaxID=1392248 RepID=A0A2I1D688_ASPC2|nr:Pkinase-domain-containing protein [Aspergillus campestris IBT 28561]PKY05392.1 Pkinase-domain-containing protein [Aspergillus campestris IBT 28561]
MAAENADFPLKDASRKAQRPTIRPVRYTSTPSSSFESPRRHHHRNPIARRPVKETLNARSEYRTSQDDGTAEHRINQYVIKQEIGRGSFGAVHLASDQFGNEFAVKEFSKSRLRKRAQSHLLRRPRGPKRQADGFNSPLHRRPPLGEDQKENALYLIKEEIAIMKKLHHSNLVSLIEVLDDPTEDSLYMVMEMCKKGVVMKVGLEERADPYDDDLCRCWFRDLILGIEYLHAQGIVHRDIKPDNCLITNDDVLKVVDFGVSEMFEKDSDMFTAKSAGSPAFLPPELCVVKHGDVSGKAADIWSMGVTLYCLRYGRLPFERQSIFELYEAIKNDPVICTGEEDGEFKDMMARILEKDPAKRISMEELRAHPWVTKGGLDPLLPESENTAEIIEFPTEEEMDSAITKTIGHVLAVMKAVKKFKKLIDPTKPESPMQSFLGQGYESNFVAPPLEMEADESFSAFPIPNKTQSLDADYRKAWERESVIKGHHPLRGFSPSNGPPDSINRPTASSKLERKDSGSIRSFNFRGDATEDAHNISTPQSPQVPLSRASSATTKRSVEGTRGHARDPLEEDFPFLFIGPSSYTGHPFEDPAEPEANEPISEDPADNMVSAEPSEMMDVDPIVSESPGAAEFDIYETAYRKEIERIHARTFPREGTTPKVYLTRRVDGRDDVMRLLGEKPSSSLSSAIDAMRAQSAGGEQQQHPYPSTSTSTPIPVPNPTPSSATGPPLPEETSRARLRSFLGRVRGSRGL